MTDEMVAALPDFENSDLFTPAEKVAIRFAEVMAGDFRALSAELSAALREHYTEPQIMALGWRMAIFVGYGRLVYVSGLQGVGGLCPLSFTHEQLQTQAEAGE
ncbi:MAG: hypothetical protein HQ511_01130 [Rhodospirillales bacterium]|nr:hypothetical protein [Rhodospirillales bacterium]